MSRRHWTYSTEASAEAVMQAFDVAEGLPRRGVSDPGGKHGSIPDTHSAGAQGWVEHVMPVDERDHPGPPEFAVERIAALMARHEGKTVRTPDHGNVTIPTNSTAQNRPATWTKKRRAAAAILVHGDRPKDRPKGRPPR